MSVGNSPPLVRLTVDQYHEMIAKGILHDGDPIELIDGIMIRKDRSIRGGDPMTHYPAHAVAISRLARQWRLAEDHGFYLRTQLPITLSGTREPEPDLALVRGSEDDYQDRHPGPSDIVAVAEVADSSLGFDRTTKQRLYAGAGIPVYWILNLVENKLEVYAEPSLAEGAYGKPRVYTAGQVADLALKLGLVLHIPIAELLPR